MSGLQLFVASRRGVLAEVSGLAVTALSDPADVRATNKDGDAKRCKRQVGKCRVQVRAQCAGDPGCLALLTCCEKPRVCKFDNFLTCLIASGAA